MIFLTWTNRCCHKVTHVRFINGDSDCPNIPEFRVNKTKTMIKRLLKNNVNIKLSHCAKSVHIRSFPGRIFPHFDWIQNRKTPNKGTFHSVSLVREVFSQSVFSEFTHREIRWSVVILCSAWNKLYHYLLLSFIKIYTLTIKSCHKIKNRVIKIWSTRQKWMNKQLRKK